MKIKVPSLLSKPNVTFVGTGQGRALTGAAKGMRATEGREKAPTPLKKPTGKQPAV